MSTPEGPQFIDPSQESGSRLREETPSEQWGKLVTAYKAQQEELAPPLSGGAGSFTVPDELRGPMLSLYEQTPKEERGAVVMRLAQDISSLVGRLGPYKDHPVSTRTIYRTLADIKKETAQEKKPYFFYIGSQGEQNLMADGWEYLNPSQIEKNLERLRAIERDNFLHSANREQFKAKLQSLEAIWKTYRSSLEDIMRDSRPISQTLPPFLPQIQPLEVNSANQPAESTLKIKDVMNASEGPQIFFHSTHAQTYYELASLKALAPEKRIGVLVLDAHADLYVTQDEYRALKQQPYDQVPSTMIAKTNVWKLAFDEDLIVGLSLAGLAQSSIENIRKGNLVYIDHAYRQYEPFISLVDETAYREGEMIYGEDFIAAVCNQVEVLQEMEADCIFISLDWDVTDLVAEGFTATEYNPLSSLVLLSVQDYAQIDEQWQRHYQASLSPEIYEKYGLRHTRIMSDDEIIRGLERVTYPRLLAERMKDYVIVPQRPRGIPSRALSDLFPALQQTCARLGVHYGVPLGGKGVVVGDITELAGYDYKGKTAKAVQQVASAMVPRRK